MNKKRITLTESNTTVHDTASGKVNGFDVQYSFSHSNSMPEIITVSATKPDSDYRVDGNYFVREKSFRVSFQGLKGDEDLTIVQYMVDGCEQIIQRFPAAE